MLSSGQGGRDFVVCSREKAQVRTLVPTGALIASQRFLSPGRCGSQGRRAAV